MKKVFTFSIIISLLLPQTISALTIADYPTQNIRLYNPNDNNCVVSGGSSGSETAAEDTRDFVRKYINAAVEVNKKYGTPYEAVLAQGILESGYGRSGLTKNANNFFGIKAGSGWSGEVVFLETQEEYTPGTTTTITDGFRKYPTIEEGWLGYGEFITNNSRYQEALKYPGDPRQYIVEIKKAGYATDSAYVEKVTKLIDQIEQVVREENLSPPSSQIAVEGGGGSGSDSAANGCTTNSGGIVAGDIIATAKGLAWDHKNYTKDPRQEYVNARNQYNPANGDYTDCSKFVATVMRASGADPEYPEAGTSTQRMYVKNSPKYQTIDNPSWSDLQPGDILVHNGHTLIYAGDQGGDVFGYHASLGGTAPIQISSGMIESQLGKSTNTLARLIKK